VPLEKFCMPLEEPAKDSPAQSSPASLARKRPASERKIQANRRNALRSTGPKTERGKRTVARNAIKHGILAREVVITAGDARRVQKNFRPWLNNSGKSTNPLVSSRNRSYKGLRLVGGGQRASFVPRMERYASGWTR
jgi:hypothetical protein